MLTKKDRVLNRKDEVLRRGPTRKEWVLNTKEDGGAKNIRVSDVLTTKDLLVDVHKQKGRDAKQKQSPCHAHKFGI